MEPAVQNLSLGLRRGPRAKIRGVSARSTSKPPFRGDEFFAAIRGASGKFRALEDCHRDIGGGGRVIEGDISSVRTSGKWGATGEKGTKQPVAVGGGGHRGH